MTKSEKTWWMRIPATYSLTAAGLALTTTWVMAGDLGTSAAKLSLAAAHADATTADTLSS